MGASFQIGRSALAAYQAAISIAGQNIANVGNPDYARLSGRLTALVGGPDLGGIAPGAGVALSGLQRHVDEALEGRLRLSLSTRAGTSLMYQSLNQVEGLYNELTDQDLSTELGQFFASFSTLQTDPSDTTARNLVIAGADRLTRTLARQRNGLLQQVADLNDSADAMTREANQLADEVAKLNEQIVAAQTRGNGGETPLKDRRDALLRQLAETIDIQVQPQENGTANVYVGSEPLVEFNRSRGLITQRAQVNGIELSTVRFADNKGAVIIRDGKLGALVATRDVHIRGQVDQLDQLARGLIYEVNRVHSSGRGLVGYTSVTGAYTVNDINAPLNSAAAGLDFPVQNGTFLVKVRDQQSGETITRQIQVSLDGLGTDTSLSSLVASLNTVPGLTASVTADNRLQITAAGGSEVSFGEDTSGALAALGVGAFFTGNSAANIAVNTPIRQDPRLIAASVSGEPGDGDNAGNLARLGTTTSALLGNRTIQNFHADIVNGLAVTTSSAQHANEAADAVYSSLLAQRESLSGVSLDEEAINLTKFERAFQGATRFLTVLDSLGDEVLALVK